MTEHPNSAQTDLRRGGRGWAYACAQLGGVVSIAANWAHSYVAPEHAPNTWTPEPGAVAFSIFWPIAVLFAVEAFARVPWPAGVRYTLIRFGGLLPVAVVAAVVSYLHLSGLLRHYGAGMFEANVGPLAIDGLMLIGTGALIVTSAGRQNTQPNDTVRPVRVEVAPLVTEHLPIAAPNTGANALPEHPAPAAANTEPEQPAEQVPNTAVEQPAEQGVDAESNVRPFAPTAAKPNSDVAANLRKIKRKHTDWRTNVPSARACAAVIGVSPSTGLSYQKKLIAEIGATKEATG